MQLIIHKYIKFFIALLLISFGINPVYASDTYDATTGHLAIPLVRAYGNVYRDVVIQIGDVVAVNGGSTTDSLDTYDSTTNQLSIPSVNAFGKIYTNVVVKVNSVISVGGIALTDLNKSIGEKVVSVDLYAASGYSGKDILFFNLVTKGDLNGDGYDDLVIGLFRHTTIPSYSGREYDPSGSIKPVILFYDTNIDSYKINEQLQSVLQAHHHPRQAMISDFDGDGRNDLFIQGHGYDDAPFGEQNSLILNKTNGFLDVTNTLPQFSDFSHGLVTADFDKNGKLDLLVLNNRTEAQTKCEKYSGFTDCHYNSPKLSESYVLFNNGLSGLSKGVLNIPDSVINFATTSADPDKRLYVGHSADFNKDSWADIIVSDHRHMYIMESIGGTGNLATAQIIDPPVALQSCLYTPFSAITSLDIDDDGQEEIVGSQSCDLGTAYFRVLKRVDGRWVDRTIDLVGSQSVNAALSAKNDGWCYKFELSDLNYDGKLDLICQSTRGQGQNDGNTFWYNINGKLQYSNIMLSDGRWHNFHTRVKAKQGNYIIGFFTQMGQSELIIRRWKN